MVKKKSVRGRPPDPARQRQRRIEVKEAAFGLFLTRGLDSVTIDQIVSAAGLAKGSFYRQFENKEALVEWVYAPITAQIRTAFERLEQALATGGPGGRSRDAYELFAAQMSVALLQDQQAALLYLQERRGPSSGARAAIAELAGHIEDQAIQNATTARSTGILPTGEPTVIGLAVIGAIEQVLFGYLTRRLPQDGPGIAAELTRLVLNALGPT